MVPAVSERAEQWGVTPGSAAVKGRDEPRRARINSQQQSQREKDRGTAT